MTLQIISFGFEFQDKIIETLSFLPISAINCFKIWPKLTHSLISNVHVLLNRSYRRTTKQLIEKGIANHKKFTLFFAHYSDRFLRSNAQ